MEQLLAQMTSLYRSEPPRRPTTSSSKTTLELSRRKNKNGNVYLGDKNLLTEAVPPWERETQEVFIDDEPPQPQAVAHPQQAVAPTPAPSKFYSPMHELEACTQKMAHYGTKRLGDGIHDHDD